MSSKSVTISGSIHSIGEIQSVGAKGFQKREVVILVEDGKFPQYLPVEFTGDKINAIDAHRVGDQISIEVNVRGRSWSGPNGTKYFLSLSAWRINGVAPTASQGGAHEPAPAGGYSASPPGEADDIPFSSCDLAREPSAIARVLR